MRRALASSLFLFVIGLLCLAQQPSRAYWQSRDSNYNQNVAAGGGGCAEATTFLARTSGLDGTHTTAYTNLICGLVTDSLWTNFDVLYVFATQDTTTAKLNLPNTTYGPATLSAGGDAPTFTNDRGYADNGSTNSWVNTLFNPSTAGSPHYVQNSAHMSVWNFTNTTAAKPSVGNSAGNSGQNIYVNFSGSLYTRINDSPEAGGLPVTGGDPRGHMLGNRSGATARQGYQNGTDLGSLGSVSSQAPINGNIIVLGADDAGIGNSAPFQIGVFSAGSSYNSTQVTSFYNRLRTYMTAIGAP